MDLNAKAKPKATTVYKAKHQPVIPDAYLPFKKALEEGKVIEVLLGNGDWKSKTHFTWTLPPSHYRIKEQPVQEQPKADSYVALKLAHSLGAEIEVYDLQEGWLPHYQPKWTLPVERYRVKPQPIVDPYAELKKAFAEGKRIEYLSYIDNQWHYCQYPSWQKNPENYRVADVETRELALYTDTQKKVWWIGHKNAQGTWEKIVTLTLSNGKPIGISFKEE